MNDHQKTKEQLIDELRFQSQLLNAVGQALIATDLMGNITYWNKSAESLYGWTLSEAIGKNIAEIVPETTKEQAEEIMAQLAKGESWSGEFIVQHKDGFTFPAIVSDAPVYDQEGNLAGIIGVSTDITARKQAEDELRESEANLQKAQQITRLGNYSWNVQTNQVQWSDTLKEILGAENVEPSYDLFLSRIHPDDYTRVIEQSRDHLENCQPLIIEYRIVRPDGSVIYVQDSSECENDEDGNAIRVFGVNLDITNFKMAEDALRKSESRLKMAEKVARLGHYEIDIASGTAIWSDETFNIFGLSPEDFNPGVQNYDQLLHEDDRETLFEAFENSIATGERFDLVYRIIRPDGEVRYLHSMGMVEQSSDGSSKMFGILQDITERKQMEDILRQRDEQLQRTIRAGNIGLWEWDFATNQVYYSPEWKSQLGYEDDEISNDFSEWKNRIHPDDIERVLQTIEAFTANPWMDYQLEFRVQHKDGTFRWILSQADILKDEQGKHVRMSGSHIDITARKLAGQRAQELEQEQFRTNILTEFITQASHEFRTPLSVINTSTYFLDKLSKSGEQEKQVQKIEQQVTNMTNLIDAMTTMSKLDSIQKINIETFDVCVLVDTIVSTRRNTIQSTDKPRNIQYQTSQEIQKLMVAADMNYIRLAIENIIDNAIRFTVEDDSIIVRVDKNDSEAIIEVKDMGIGIKDELLPRIFERFYRLDAVGKTRGFGLGLPITKRIVELHHGNIEVDSEAGEGSIFRITLPLG